jgi:hypothetical protein
LVRINEVQTQDDDITLEIDSVSGKRQVKAGGIGTTQLASGAAADNVIGNRQVEDNPASDVLPEADTGFTLAQWLQKIRDNLKFALSKFIAKVDGVEPNASRNVQVLRRITLAEAQALIDDPTQAEPGVKYYVPETGDLLIERPDYANQETINRITTNNGSWTVDRPGYVNAQVYNGNVTATRSIFINDKLVMRNGPPYSDAWGVYQVSKGDVIILSSGSTTGFSCSCYFIPSKFSIIKNPTLVVEPGSDYSYDEQPVMIQLPDGTVRQKLTEKGNPLFRRTFTFSFTTAASTERVQKWQTSGIFLKRVVEGWWVNTSEPFAKNPIGVITIVNPDPTNTTQFSTYLDCLNGGTARLWWANSYGGLFNVTIQGHVTLEYTKVFESE